MALGGTTAVEEELSEEISTAIAAAEAAVTDNASEAVLRANRAELKGAAITMVTAVRQETLSLFFFVSLSLSLSLSLSSLDLARSISMSHVCSLFSSLFLPFPPSSLPPSSLCCLLSLLLSLLSIPISSLSRSPPSSLSLAVSFLRPTHSKASSHQAMLAPHCSRKK